MRPVLSLSRPYRLMHLAVALLLLQAARGGPALAAEPDPRARAEASARLKKGAELIDAEDLEGALEQFEAAYRLVPSPSILHNFGIVYQGLGRKAAALDAFERFLAEASRAPPATREHAQRAVQALAQEVGTLRVDADVSGATIFVDGRNVGRTPQERAIYLDPGPHHVSVEKSDLGTSHAERVDVAAGQRLTVQARLARPAAPLPSLSAGAPEPSVPRWRAATAWGAAVGAAVASGMMGVQLMIRYREIIKFNGDEDCGTDYSDKGGPDCQQWLTKAGTASRWAIASGLAAGALALGSVVLFATRPERAEGLSVSLRASGSHLGLGLQGRF